MMNDYSQLKQTIEMFLRGEIEVVFRGTSLPESIKPYLPITWQNTFVWNISIADVIQEVWKDGSPLFAPFYQRLQERIIEVAIIFTPSAAYFAYIFQHENRFFTFLGGMPATTKDIDQREKELDIMLPLHYQNFLSIHNGFLLDGWGSVGIRPLNKLYKIGNLLGFCGDGSGNEQCFLLQ